MRFYKTTVSGFIPNGGPAGYGAPRRPGARLLFFGLAVLGLGLLWKHKSEARPAPPAPSHPRIDMSAWRGSWEQTDGNALILFKDDGTGVYSPDGKARVPFRASVNSVEATFRVKVQGRTWKMQLTSAGHLTGLPETALPSAPAVIFPGRSQAEKDHDAELRKAETRAMLVPADKGQFKKAG